MKKKKIKPVHRTVMLIDDNEIDNFINQKMLEAAGFADQVFVHTSGRSALEFLMNLDKAGAALAQMKPEFIFLDINMPLMDGFQFAEEFEKLSEAFKTGIKIAVLTTSMNPADKQQSEKFQSIVQFVSKPLTEEAMGNLGKL